MPIPIPPVNATLTRIDGVEYVTNAYGDEVAQPVERWAGTADAYTTEKNEYVPRSDGGVVLAYTAQVSIPSNLAIAPGEYLTYERNGSETTRVVDAVEDRADAGFFRCFVRDAG